MTSIHDNLPILSKRYAGALLDLGEQENAIKALVKDVQALDDLFNESEPFAAAVLSPLVQQASMLAAIKDIAKKLKFHKLMENFLCVLTVNRRLEYLPTILVAFNRMLLERSDVLLVRVQVARPLTKAQEKEIEKVMAERSGKEVVLDVSIEPGIIGGMIIYSGAQCIDCSVSGKLTRLKERMLKHTVNE